MAITLETDQILLIVAVHGAHSYGGSLHYETHLRAPAGVKLSRGDHFFVQGTTYRIYRVVWGKTYDLTHWATQNIGLATWEQSNMVGQASEVDLCALIELREESELEQLAAEAPNAQ